MIEISEGRKSHPLKTRTYLIALLTAIRKVVEKSENKQEILDFINDLLERI